MSFFKRLTGKKKEEAYAGSAADHVGWIWDDPSSTYLNVTPRFDQFVSALCDKSFQLPPDALNYTYYLVPGLFTNKYPGYMEEPEKAMKNLGLQVIKLKIDTGGSVENNASLIKFEIERAPDNKKVVLIGHSKGAVDAAAALSLYPELSAFVRCFITLQAPFGGTPIPQDVMGASGLLNAIVETLKIFDPSAMKDIAYKPRREFLNAHPFPADQIPTLSFGSFTNKAAPLCSSTQKHIEKKYGALSDGLVPLKDAFVSGSAIVILEGADHGAPVFSFGDHKQYTPGRIFLALIATALEMPPNVYRLCKHPISPVLSEPTGEMPRQGEAFLYEHTNFNGECLKLKGDCENLADYCLNNAISSIRVGPNTVLEVFDNVYFAGIYERIEGENGTLPGHLNDRISSCRIVVPSLVPPPSAHPNNAPFDWTKAAVNLNIAHSLVDAAPGQHEIWGYPHPNYQGAPLGYRGDLANIPELIAAIRLGPFVAVTAFPAPNFAGAPYEITGDHPTLPLRIVSMRVHAHHSVLGAAAVSTFAAASAALRSPNTPAAVASAPRGADATPPPSPAYAPLPNVAPFPAPYYPPQYPQPPYPQQPQYPQYAYPPVQPPPP